MVYELVASAGHRLDPAAAEALYAGSRPTPGSSLQLDEEPRACDRRESPRCGVEPARCFREVYERNSPAWTRLLGRALASLRLDAGGRIVSVRITSAMETECGAEGADTSE